MANGRGLLRLSASARAASRGQRWRARVTRAVGGRCHSVTKFAPRRAARPAEPCGTLGRNRTGDPPLRRRVLYPLSYEGAGRLRRARKQGDYRERTPNRQDAQRGCCARHGDAIAPAATLSACLATRHNARPSTSSRAACASAPRSPSGQASAAGLGCAPEPHLAREVSDALARRLSAANPWPRPWCRAEVIAVQLFSSLARWAMRSLAKAMKLARILEWNRGFG